MVTKLLSSDIWRLTEAGVKALQIYRSEIDALNVFPVPDGDTGTNMLLTMQAVMEELNRCPEETITSYARAIADGSLMGARGNSGVILSQILRGFCEVISPLKEIKAEDLVVALENSARVAYQAVTEPVEGTMLTVIKDMAAAAKQFYKRSGGVTSLLEEILREGERSLLRTPELLDILREAGVVDAGGKGLVVLAESALLTLKGERMVTPVQTTSISSRTSMEEQDLEYLYCTEFLLQGEKVDIDEFRKELNSLGGSLLVIGSDGLFRTHIHTNQPDKVLEAATKRGMLSQVRINNMQEQTEKRRQILMEREKPLSVASEIEIVAVAVGEGLKRILRSLGVKKIVEGGQSMNPSTAELVKVVEEAGARKVIILPNNKNVILAAEQAAGLTSKEVVVIPTRSIPEAFSALLAFDEEKSLTSNQQAMLKALRQVKSGEVSQAVRDSSSSRREIKKGDFIGIFNNQIVTVEKSLIQASLDLISRMVDEESEVVTIITGKTVSEAESRKLEEKLSNKYPELEIEIQKGDQPLYPIIVGVE